MNQLIQSVSQTPIEIALGIDENGMTTSKKLYEFLEMDASNYSKWVKRNILDNEFAENGTDFYSYQMTSEGRGNFAQDFKLTAEFAKKLSMIAKNEKGEQARDYFVKAEEVLKQLAKPKCIEDVLIESLQEMKAMRVKFAEQDKQIEYVDGKVEGIREIISLDTTSWRTDTQSLINKIAISLGGGQEFSNIREESYKLLNLRMGVDVATRLTNLRRRMAEEGASVSKRNKMSYLDVVSNDKKLIEGYVAIVKEMAIKYGVA